MYFSGCLIAFLIYLFGRYAFLNNKHLYWPVVFLWPVLLLSPVYLGAACLVSLIRWKLWKLD